MDTKHEQLTVFHAVKESRNYEQLAAVHPHCLLQQAPTAINAKERRERDRIAKAKNPQLWTAEEVERIPDELFDRALNLALAILLENPSLAGPR